MKNSDDIKGDKEEHSGEDEISRRLFLKKVFQGTAGLYAASVLGGSLGSFIMTPETIQAQDKATSFETDGILGEDERFIAPARFWEKLPDKKVRCKLCPKECEVANLERGFCGVRENRDGEYKTLVYNRVCSMNVDPVEKKPFFHFLPGSRAFSFSTAGCNFECKYCQNWQISQFRPEQVRSVYMTPDKIVAAAKQTGCKSIAFTYGEPSVFYEFMYDVAVKARENGIKPIVVSNGYLQEEPLRELCKVVDGIKVDFKGFSEGFYRDVCMGDLQPVLRNLKIIKEEGVWLELVVLVIPTKNDSPDEIDRMSKWIIDNLGADVPIHFSRFHPEYKLKNLPATPMKTLEQCHEITRKNGVKFVYLGNVWNHKYENTYCPKCGTLLIDRIGYQVETPHFKNGLCPKCSEPIPGFWS